MTVLTQYGSCVDCKGPWTDLDRFRRCPACATRRDVTMNGERSAPANRKDWRKLPPVPGFTRVADDCLGRRMARCDKCGEVIPTLGVGYHYSRKDHQ